MYRNSSMPGPSSANPKKERKARGWSMFNRGGSSAHVTDSGATVLWLPYCSHKDRCVDSTEACKTECLRLVTDLNREVSSHHSLARTLGGSGDNSQLRDELKRTRKRAQELTKQARLKLMPALSDSKLNEKDRAEIERLWYLYCCCVCILEGDMQRSLSLLRLFSLSGAPAGFINTGLHEFGGICAVLHHKPVATVAAVAAMGGFRPPTELNAPQDKTALETAELNQLHKEIVDLREVVPEFQKGDHSVIDMKEWQQHMEQQNAAQNNGKTKDGSENNEQSLEEECQVGIEGEGMSLQQRRFICYLLVGLVSVLAVAAVLCALLAVLF
ncbi:regulator of G-protein signaling 9-binding protein-like [Neocloeon triangulifer]|uniref:regulator of G-protein signaling 9-binding protein-like n=1 Tax=Neocloeon triangulifer TaxID=2078957 RepID=UPI00286ED76B|nr:regulator of G-protein signaling 9-binding protein-like [Neocloeon triangulifer]